MQKAARKAAKKAATKKKVSSAAKAIKKSIASRRIALKTASGKKSEPEMQANAGSETSQSSRPSLTKKVLRSAARKAFAQAALKSMQTMGHVTVIENGWVVRKNSDGSIVRVKQMKVVNTPLRLE